MNWLEIYSLLFTDILISNLAFYPSSGLILSAMKIFDTYNNSLMLVVSIVAYIISICINYVFGISCYKILSPVNKNLSNSNKKIKSFREFQFLFIVISLSFIPIFGNFIILLLGFCRINFLQTIVIATLVKLIYYIIIIF